MLRNRFSLCKLESGYISGIITLSDMATSVASEVRYIVTLDRSKDVSLLSSKFWDRGIPGATLSFARLPHHPQQGRRNESRLGETRAYTYRQWVSANVTDPESITHY